MVGRVLELETADELAFHSAREGYVVRIRSLGETARRATAGGAEGGATETGRLS
jgi:hypothetical protein